MTFTPNDNSAFCDAMEGYIYESSMEEIFDFIPDVKPIEDHEDYYCWAYLTDYTDGSFDDIPLYDGPILADYDFED